MAKMKITIEIPNRMGLTDTQIGYILMDALWEFQTNRGPSSKEYVDRRYPDILAYKWLDRDRKIKDTDERKLTAEEMRCSIKVEEIGDSGYCPEPDSTSPEFQEQWRKNHG